MSAANQPKRTKCAACPLKKIAIFREPAEEEAAFIEKFKEGELTVDAGATILSEGNHGQHLYTVLSGWTFRYKMLPDGRRQILNFAMPGDFLGLQSSIMAEMEHSVEALTDTVLCVFSRERIWELYSNYPSLAFDLTWLSARNESMLDESLLSVGRRAAIERIAHLLLILFHKSRDLDMVKGNKLTLPLTQLHLADALGLSLVHTNKTLNALSARKLFKWRGNAFEMLDEEGLLEVANAEAPNTVPRPLI